MTARPLPDWPAVRRYLASMSPLCEIPGDDAMRIPVEHPDRIMEFFARHLVHASGWSWVYLGSRIGHAVGVDLDQLLRRPRPGAIGALCLARDHLCVGHNLPVRSLTTEDVDRVLAGLAAATRAYLPWLDHRADADLSSFSHLVD